MTPVLSAADVAVLNEARTICVAVAGRVDTDYDGGQITCQSRTTEWQIFQLLNVANVHGLLGLSYEQLHNQAEAQASS